jgi:adenylate cyclase
MIEIERKFFVTDDSFKAAAFAKNRIAQGYLSSVPERTVRSTNKGEKDVDHKGISNDSGMSRFEWKKKFLYQQRGIIVMRKGVIDKTRLKSNVALIFMRSMSFMVKMKD